MLDNAPALFSTLTWLYFDAFIFFFQYGQVIQGFSYRLCIVATAL